MALSVWMYILVHPCFKQWRVVLPCICLLGEICPLARLQQLFSSPPARGDRQKLRRKISQKQPRLLYLLCSVPPISPRRHTHRYELKRYTRIYDLAATPPYFSTLHASPCPHAQAHGCTSTGVRALGKCGVGRASQTVCPLQEFRRGYFFFLLTASRDPARSIFLRPKRLTCSRQETHTNTWESLLQNMPCTKMFLQ